MSRDSVASLQLAQATYRAARQRCAFRTAPASSRPGLCVSAKPDFRARAIIDIVGAKRVAEQGRRSQRCGAAFEIRQQRGADAVALPAVVDRQAELDAGLIGIPRVARLGDDTFDTVDSGDGDHTEAIVVAGMGEVVKQARRQLAGGAEKAPVA